MAIHQWPHKERPRERLLSLGAESLSDAELLAILLNHGTKGKSAVDLARELLVQHRGLRGLFACDYREFCQHQGIGMAKFTQLQAALELSRRHLQEPIMRDGIITRTQDAEQFLIASLSREQREVFGCLFLDSQHRVIRFERLFHGTINRANVHPRIVVKKALQYNAAAVIAAHNHPSGIAEPSEADEIITKTLADALALVEVTLLDHIIVGGNQVTSLAERGRIRLA